MPLPKPNPGDPLKANAITDNANYTEANRPLPGDGITIRRTPAGSTISISAAKQLATNGADGGDVEPTETPFPHDVLSIDSTGKQHKSPIDSTYPATTPFAFLTRTTEDNLGLAIPKGGLEMSAVYGEAAGVFAKKHIQKGNTYGPIYAFLTRNENDSWSWRTPYTSDSVDKVLAKNEAGWLINANVIEFTCPVSATSGGTETITV